MGHNWVLTKKADFQSVAQAGASAGMENDYVPPDDDRVIAATEIIGGGESTSVTFSIADLNPDEPYQFFCSFPGHWATGSQDTQHLYYSISSVYKIGHLMGENWRLFDNFL